jgi:hypothetical protein
MRKRSQRLRFVERRGPAWYVRIFVHGLLFSFVREMHQTPIARGGGWTYFLVPH